MIQKEERIKKRRRKRRVKKVFKILYVVDRKMRAKKKRVVEREI